MISQKWVVQVFGSVAQKEDAVEAYACTSPVESLDDLLASAKRTLESASLWDPLQWDTENDGLMANLLSTSHPVSAPLGGGGGDIGNGGLIPVRHTHTKWGGGPLGQSDFSF